jgi:hypothetical protein
MKKLALSLGLLFLGAVAFTSNVNAQVAGAEVSFDKEVHDYGNVKQGGNGECEFKFTNTGSEPLIISDAKGSCGCTVPEWPKTPIKPGETASIKVKYDTKRVGPINKTVTVTSNATTEPTKTLRIKGTVEAVEGGGAPLNNGGGPAEGK